MRDQSPSEKCDDKAISDFNVTKQPKNHYQVIVLGGGAAGLMAAAVAGQRGRSVVLLEKSNKLGKKILMSGGGRCNFTNLEVTAKEFICNNPHFVKSALNQYTQWDFISLVAKYGVEYHEKTLGQLFCDHSSKDILNLLERECEDAGVVVKTNVEVASVEYNGGEEAIFELTTDAGCFQSESLIVATGRLSIPTLGGSGFGYELAEQFGLQLNPTEASLVPFTLTGQLQELSSTLSGVSLPVHVSVPTQGFSEGLLFTHRGLSGPAILQISNYWQLGESIVIDLCPQADLATEAVETKRSKPSSTLFSLLNKYLPKSFVSEAITRWWPELDNKPLQEIKDAQLHEVARQLHTWTIKPSGTEGYRTAEVTRGGVDVAAISSKTMEVKSHPGLYFIGEVLDVTGHLGGYNFQWAWSSGYVAGLNA